MAQDILTLPPIEVATMPNAAGDSYQQAIRVGDEFWVVGANGTNTRVWRGSGTTWQQYGGLLGGGGIENSGSSQFAQSGMLATDGTINGIFLAHLIRMANGEALPSTDGCPPFTNLGAGVRIYHYDPVDDVFKRINRAIQPPLPAPAIDDSLMGLTNANNSTLASFPKIIADEFRPGICHVIWGGIGQRRVRVAASSGCTLTTHAQSVHYWTGGEPGTWDAPTGLLGYETFLQATEVPLGSPPFASGYIDGDQTTHSGRIHPALWMDEVSEKPRIAYNPYLTYSLAGSGTGNLDDEWHIAELDPDRVSPAAPVEIATIATSDISPPPTDPAYKPYYISVSDVFSQDGDDWRYIWGSHESSQIFINRILADFSASPEAFEGDTVLSLLPGGISDTNTMPQAKYVAGREVWLPANSGNTWMYEYGFAENEWTEAYTDNFTFPFGISSQHNFWFYQDTNIYFIGFAADAAWGANVNKWEIFSFNYGTVGFYHLESEPILVIAP